MRVTSSDDKSCSIMLFCFLFLHFNYQWMLFSQEFILWMINPPLHSVYAKFVYIFCICVIACGYNEHASKFVVSAFCYRCICIGYDQLTSNLNPYQNELFFAFMLRQQGNMKVNLMWLMTISAQPHFFYARISISDQHWF